MKPIILALFFFIGLLHIHAADEPFIPNALNAILPKIRAGLTIPEVEAALAPAYPNVKGRTFMWSGQTGYINYKLDERYSLHVSSITRDAKEVVHEQILLYLYDSSAKRRIDLTIFDWEKNEEKKPPADVSTSFDDPVTAFSVALLPLLTSFEQASLQTTLRGFIARGDSFPGFRKSETEPSEHGLYLNVAVSEDVKKLSDYSEQKGGLTHRLVQIPAPMQGQQSLVIKLAYGPQVEQKVIRAIDGCISRIAKLR